MSKKQNSRAAFLALRARVRHLVETAGVPLVPGADQTGTITELVGDLIARLHPEISAAQDALRVEASDVDEHFGALMVAYGEAGYSVGLAMGMELAALTGGAR
jgi:hypothetical protein